jgi:hypothetical protein
VEVSPKYMGELALAGGVGRFLEIARRRRRLKKRERGRNRVREKKN